MFWSFSVCAGGTVGKGLSSCNSPQLFSAVGHNPQCFQRTIFHPWWNTNVKVNILKTKKVSGFLQLILTEPGSNKYGHNFSPRWKYSQVQTLLVQICILWMLRMYLKKIKNLTRSISLTDCSGRWELQGNLVTPSHDTTFLKNEQWNQQGNDK